MAENFENIFDVSRLAELEAFVKDVDFRLKTHTHDGLGSTDAADAFINNNEFITNITNETGAGAKTCTFIVGPASNDDSDGYDYTTDGTADEVQIQAAIDALPATGGKVVLREGTYNINIGTTLYSASTYYSALVTKPNVTIQGMGWSTKLILNATDVSDYTTIISANTGLKIKDIYFDGIRRSVLGGNEGTGSFISGFAATGLTDAEISGCYFYDPYGSAIHNGNGYCSIHDNVFRIFESGIDAGGVVWTGFGTTVTNNIFYSEVTNDGTNMVRHIDGFGGDADVIDGNTYISTGTGCFDNFSFENIIVTNNTCLATAADPQQFMISGANEWSIIANNFIRYYFIPGDGFCDAISGAGVISGNFVIDCDRAISTSAWAFVDNNYLLGCRYGIDTFGPVVSDNFVDNRTSVGVVSGTKVGIDITPDSNDCVCTGNIVKSDISGTEISIGIRVASGSTPSVNISNNYIFGSTTRGIQISGIETQSVVSGNVINGARTGITSNNGGVRKLNVSNNNIFGAASSAIYENGIALGSTTDAGTSNDNVITGNIIHGFGKEGIKLTNFNYSIISNNNIKNIGTSADNTYAGILLRVGTTTGFSKYNTLNSNVIRSDDAVHYAYGIRENSSSDGPNIITSNIAVNWDTAGISTQHGSSVTDNNITS